MELNKKDLLEIKGGAITATFINAIARGINTMMNLGRNLGSALRRLYKGKVCSI